MPKNLVQSLQLRLSYFLNIQFFGCVSATFYAITTWSMLTACCFYLSNWKNSCQVLPTRDDCALSFWNSQWFWTNFIHEDFQRCLCLTFTSFLLHFHQLFCMCNFLLQCMISIIKNKYSIFHWRLEAQMWHKFRENEVLFLFRIFQFSIRKSFGDIFWDAVWVPPGQFFNLVTWAVEGCDLKYIEVIGKNLMKC